MLFDRLKTLFKKTPVPKAARDLLENAESTGEILKGLDELITRNEVELEELHKEIEGLEELEKTEAERVRFGELGIRSKKNSLRKIQRLRKQMDNVEDRVRIHDANINLLIQLVGKIQSVESMEMRGVGEEQIDSILLEFESQLDDYSDVLQTGEIEGRSVASMELPADRELESLEKEILSPDEAEESADSGEGEARVETESSGEGGVGSAASSAGTQAVPESRREGSRDSDRVSRRQEPSEGEA